MKQKIGIFFFVVLLCPILFQCCNSKSSMQCNSTTEYTNEVILGYGNWADSSASSHLLKAVIEKYYNAPVRLEVMDANQLWENVANGEIDFMASAWLPNTQKNYARQFADSVVILGPYFTNAKIGLVVPSYVNIDTIYELETDAEKFDYQIVGIDPGAGIMYRTITAKSEYKLKNLTLIQGSDLKMTNALEDAYEDEKWIVVTGWNPHWIFDKMDLKYLEDPLGVFGSSEQINIITQLQFASEYPKINKFLENFQLNSEEYQSLIRMMEEYEDKNEAANIWIEKNKDTVESWIR